LPPVEPWPEPVNGAEVLDEIVSGLNRVLVFPDWGPEASALFAMHTYAFQLRDLTAYLAIESPEKECGKSTLLMAISLLVERPVVSTNISSSAFFHAIEELIPILIIDEGDTNLRTRRELRGMLNGGYTRATAYIWRVMQERRSKGNGNGGAEAGRGSGLTLMRYTSWCPKAIATIGHLNDILASRCIVIRMHRKLEGEECARLKTMKWEDLRRKCKRFVMDHAQEIANAEPKMPAGLSNRAADIWEPLLALADLAGGRWPELARQAAVGLTTRAQQHSPIGALLLDILLIFVLRKTERVFSRDMVLDLNRNPDRPWAELRRGRAVNETWLAAQLRPYGIAPRTIRIGEEVAKGYLQEEFEETFRRYIPKSELEAFKEELRARAVPKKEGGTEGQAMGNGGK